MTKPNLQIRLGEDTFQLSMLSASKSFELQPRIWPAIAEVLGAMGAVAAAMPEGATMDSVDTKQLLPQLVPLVGRVFAALPPGDLRYITRELLSGCLMNGKLLFSGGGAGDIYDLIMQGRTLDTWLLLWHAVRVNYPDFFGLLGAGGKAQAKASPSAE